MTGKLYGRHGAYEPGTPEEKAKARRQHAKRTAEASAVLGWKEKHRWCVNGCGQEAAWYDNGLALRFGGACSSECLAAYDARDDMSVGEN